MGPDGATQKRKLGDVIKSPENAMDVADLIEKNGDPQSLEIAAMLRNTFSPKVPGLRR
jgi:hypothetical protein